MSRAQAARKDCNLEQARQRLVDARQFLEAAELLDAPDVVATNAIHAAIAASDAITGHSLGQRSAGANHLGAVDLLRMVDARSATALKRALDRRTQAAYESADLSRSAAANCVKWARQLLGEAESRLEA